MRCASIWWGWSLSLLVFGLGALAWYLMNRFWDWETEARKAVEHWGDFLEILLDLGLHWPEIDEDLSVEGLPIQCSSSALGRAEFRP
jgi:hypothetical protein